MSRVNHSTLKALEVLEMLAEADEGLRLMDIAGGTGYPSSAVRRLLVSLIERGYVEQDDQSNRYYRGTKILTLQAQGIRHRHVSVVVPIRSSCACVRNSMRPSISAW